MANALSAMMPRPVPMGVDPTRRMPVPGMETSTAVAPAPMPAPQTAPRSNALAMPMGANFNPPKPKQQNMLLSSAVNGFQRGLDPKGWQAGQDQAKADKAEGVKKQIAMLQNIRALPMEQRMQALPQISQSIGKQIPPELMQDEAIDTHLAVLMGEAGMAPNIPEPMSEYQRAQLAMEQEKLKQPRNQFIQGPDGAISVGNLNDGTIRQLQPGQPKPDPANYDMVTTADGVIAVNKRNPNDKIMIGAAPPRSAAGDGVGFQSLTPAQVAERGYPPGTVVQVDSRGKEYVNSRPSTQQTGQPTESERAAGLHATVSINGLRNIMAKEGAGYNRAGGMEQVAGIVGGENERLYDQAADEFIDGYLRAMTGAAATKSEIDTYKRQWFPAFGDSDAVIKQKSAGRLNALKGMKSKAGRAWNPEWDGMIADLEQQAAPAQQNEGPKFPDGTPITQERLQQLNPQMRSIYAAQLAAYEKDNGNDDAFIDSLFPSDPQVQDAGVELPAGVTPEEWDAMTPEEQALFQ